MKCAIYARVSTRKQDEANQLNQLREFAKKQGWEVVTEYCDVVSGSGKQERPRFLAMMQDASQCKFDLLLFWSLDRLSREGIVKTLGYLQQFKSWKVGWRSATRSRSSILAIRWSPTSCSVSCQPSLNRNASR
jgi:DNA invertase Pin-like site-specific DNA recombinase